MTKEKQLEELLQLLTEECAEVIQAISKAKRFTFDKVYKGKSNLKNFQQEVGDVITLVIILTRLHPDLLNDEVLDDAVNTKIKRLKKRVKFLKDFTLDQPEDTEHA